MVMRRREEYSLKTIAERILLASVEILEAARSASASNQSEAGALSTESKR